MLGRMELKIEGPLPGSNYPLCSVLRCAAEGAFLATLITEEDRRVVERLLCTEHKEAIDAGEAWLWDAEQSVFLMGPDRTGDGRLIVTTYTISRGIGGDSALGYAPVVVELTGEDGRTVAFAVSGPTATDLGKALTQFGHGG